MPKVQIPFAGGAYNMPATQLDAQTCVNWYTVVDKTGKYQYTLAPRPGLKMLIEGTESAMRGLLELNDTLYVVLDNKLYAITLELEDNQDANSLLGTRKLLGTLETSTGLVKIINNDLQLLICDGISGYVYQIVGTDIYDKGAFFKIKYASSTIGEPVFGGKGVNDLSASGKYLGDISTYYIVEIDGSSTYIENPVYTGSGLNDLTSTGYYTGTTSLDILVKIDGSNISIGTPSFNGIGINDLSATGYFSGTDTTYFRVQIDQIGVGGSPDTFKWSTDGGVSWKAQGVQITTGPQVLENGFAIEFENKNGHIVNDYWNITVNASLDINTFRWSLDNGTSWKQTYVPITMLQQALQDGVVVIFGAKRGHILDDVWTIKVVVTTTTGDTFKWSDDNGVTWKGRGTGITGSSQKLSQGVSIAFNSTTGHSMGDLWKIFMDIDNAFYPPVFPASQDGYGIYPMQNSNRFYISAINDFNSVDPLEYVSANVYQDNNVAAISVNQEVYIIKEKSIQIYNNVGATTNSAFPFQVRSNYVINYGCEAPFTIAIASNNIILLLGRNKNGARVVLKIQNYNVSVISTEPLNAELLTYSKVNDAYADVIEINNHIFYYISFPSQGKTWVCDLTTDNLWSSWSSIQITQFPAPISYIFGCFRGMFHAMLSGKHVIGDNRSGKIFEITQSSFVDDDIPIYFERVPPHFSSDGKWISINEIVIDVERGVGLTTGQGSDPTIMLQISRDGGKTWGSRLWRSLGKIGKYKTRGAIWSQLGTDRQFTFKIMCTDPVFNYVMAIIADVEVFD